MPTPAAVIQKIGVVAIGGSGVAYLMGIAGPQLAGSLLAGGFLSGAIGTLITYCPRRRPVSIRWSGPSETDWSEGISASARWLPACQPADAPIAYTLTELEPDADRQRGPAEVLHAGRYRLEARVQATADSDSLDSQFEFTIRKKKTVLSWDPPAELAFSDTNGKLKIAETDNSLPISYELIYPWSPGVFQVSAHCRGDENHSAESLVRSVEVLPGEAKVTWNPPEELPYGSVLAGIQCASGSPSGGDYVFKCDGRQLNWATLPPRNKAYIIELAYMLANYATVKEARKVKVTKAPLKVAWNDRSQVYGQGLTADFFNATCSEEATESYALADSSAPLAVGDLLNVNTYNVQATFTPTDSSLYLPTIATAKLAVMPAEPVITWTGPDHIKYGAIDQGAYAATVANPHNPNLVVDGAFGEFAPPVGELAAPDTPVTLHMKFHPLSANYVGKTSSRTVGCVWVTDAEIQALLTEEVKNKILFGRVVGGRLTGAHSSTLLTNAAYECFQRVDRTDNTVSCTVRLGATEKHSTLAPASWSDNKCLWAILQVRAGNVVQTLQAAELRMQVVDGVEWAVITDLAGNITSAFPTGGNGFHLQPR